MSTKNPELTASEEQDTAIRILKLEDDLRTTLRGVPACRAILEAKGGTVARTRHASVGLLTAARALARTENADPALLARAGAEWKEAQALRWLLASSAQRVARREARRSASHHLSVEDLEQEGMLGLIGAAERYEPGRGVRFAAYARWWVRAQITCAIQGASTFRISAGALETHRNLRKLIQIDEQVGALRPVSDLAAELGVPQQRLRDVMAACALRAVTESVGADAQPVIAELPDAEGRTPEDQASGLDSVRWLRAAIEKTFAGRDHVIMERRYGIDCEVASIATIAQDLALSTERVRQLEQQCIATLRELFAREMAV